MTEETLFHMALQQPAAERAAFLEKMCAGDDALRQRVAALLHAVDSPGDFLGQSPVKLQATTSMTPPPRSGRAGKPRRSVQTVGADR